MSDYKSPVRKPATVAYSDTEPNTHAATEQREFDISGRTVRQIQITVGIAEVEMLAQILRAVGSDYGSVYTEYQQRFSREYVMVLDSLR